MKLKNGRISILFDHDGLTIELHDQDASIQFADIRLNQKQTCQALSRLGYTTCEISVRSLEKVGKVREHQTITFKMPEAGNYSTRKALAAIEADQVCPEGWDASHYFSSQDSFFEKDGKTWARTTIMRWVEPEVGE